jgi:hypothetical protein
VADAVDDSPAPRQVWRRAAPSAEAVNGEGKPRHCGGDLDIEERYQLLKERRRKRKEAEALAREQDEARAKEAARQARDGDDVDEDKAAERFRNDRYAVKLLQQDNAAWGGGGAGPGDIG